MNKLDYRAATEKFKPGKELDEIILNRVIKKFDFDNELNFKGVIPNFSTDITSAFTIVDLIQKRSDGVFMLAGPQSAYAEESWRCVFADKWWYENESPYSYGHLGESAAHSICIASLFFIGYDEDVKEMSVTF